ncbi:hypothetical protein HKCCSP123_18460 [Rhodobacterales bacterium HKCCSP123]|nr:hypothetical protein [Rhodobacterales bacterium HKCCSP123]
MGSLKTGMAALLGLFLVLPASVRADQGEPTLPRFAECAGRLVAQMEHEWLLSDPASAETEATLDAVAAVLELMAPGGTVETRAWRASARAAHRRLLSSASFGRAHWAGDAARRYILGCTALVVLPERASVPGRS